MTDGTVQERWCHVGIATATEYAAALFYCLRLHIEYRAVGKPLNGFFVRGRDLVYLNALFVALAPVALDTTRLPPCNLEAQDALTAMRVLGVPPERWATEAVAFLVGAP